MTDRIENYGRPTDQEILAKFDECENPVTRSVMKDTIVSRLRDAVARIEELEAQIEILQEELETRDNE